MSQHRYGKDPILLTSVRGEEVYVAISRYVTDATPLIKVRRYCGEMWMARSSAGTNMAHTKRQALRDARLLIDRTLQAPAGARRRG